MILEATLLDADHQARDWTEQPNLPETPVLIVMVKPWIDEADGVIERVRNLLWRELSGSVNVVVLRPEKRAAPVL